tara:strand:- start:1985 stop:2167 length:183 start_codon:yes stop_codon:yes gene_type:complete
MISTEVLSQLMNLSNEEIHLMFIKSLDGLRMNRRKMTPADKRLITKVSTMRDLCIFEGVN